MISKKCKTRHQGSRRADVSRPSDSSGCVKKRDAAFGILMKKRLLLPENISIRFCRFKRLTIEGKFLARRIQRSRALLDPYEMISNYITSYIALIEFFSRSPSRTSTLPRTVAHSSVKYTIEETFHSRISSARTRLPRRCSNVATGSDRFVGTSVSFEGRSRDHKGLARGPIPSGNNNAATPPREFDTSQVPLAR